jgi:hypothetical protein
VAETGTVLALLESSLYLHPAGENSGLDWFLVVTVCAAVGIMIALSIYSTAKSVKEISSIEEKRMIRLPSLNDIELDPFAEHRHIKPMNSLDG